MKEFPEPGKDENTGSYIECHVSDLYSFDLVGQIVEEKCTRHKILTGARLQ